MTARGSNDRSMPSLPARIGRPVLCGNLERPSSATQFEQGPVLNCAPECESNVEKTKAVAVSEFHSWAWAHLHEACRRITTYFPLLAQRRSLVSVRRRLLLTAAIGYRKALFVRLLNSHKLGDTGI